MLARIVLRVCIAKIFLGGGTSYTSYAYVAGEVSYEIEVGELEGLLGAGLEAYFREGRCTDLRGTPLLAKHPAAL